MRLLALALALARISPSRGAARPASAHCDRVEVRKERRACRLAALAARAGPAGGDGAGPVRRPRNITIGDPAHPPTPRCPTAEADWERAARCRQAAWARGRANGTAPWQPRRFSHFANNVARGLNVLNARSGCQMAAWVYRGGVVRRHSLFDDCAREARASPAKTLAAPADAARLRPGDTLYVLLKELEGFVENFLPHVESPFVLLTGSFQSLAREAANFSRATGRAVVAHPHVAAWVCRDPPRYTRGQHDHPKVSGLPLGLKPLRGGFKKAFLNPIPTFRRKLLQHAGRVAKTTKIFAGPLGTTTKTRRGIPAAKGKLLYDEYLDAIAASRYVVSPDGVHPECHRHYEALGLGAIPLTELDPKYYGYFGEGPIVFNNTVWDVGALEAALPERPPPPNRNLVFEEYWMEHIERTVGRPLRWWDVHQKGPSLLSAFVASPNPVNYSS